FAPIPPALSTAESAPRLIARRGRTPSEVARWIFGALLLLILATWLIDSFVSSPSRFTEGTLIGFTSGSIYALVALGYTLVYGIIELINFAHGDNFMLGTFQTQSLVVDGSFQIPLLFGVLSIPLGTAATADSSSTQRLYTVLVSVVLTMLFCMTINVT